MITKTMPIGDIKNNPKNPRLIKDDKFKKLVASIKEFPEMLEAREIVVNKDYIILGGNMRFKAAKEAGLKEVPVKIVDWSEEQQTQFVIKDNVSGGEWDWDILANEWDVEELDTWGLDLPNSLSGLEAPDETTANDQDLKTIVVVAYENINDLDKITDLYNLEAVTMTETVKADLGSARKYYVFKQ